MKFLAKCRPDQTYEEHVWGVYQTWKELIDRHAGLVLRICRLHKVDQERFLLGSLLCVAFHDMGKLSANFQRIMYSATEQERHRAITGNFRHEFASTAFAYEGSFLLTKVLGPLCPLVPKAPLEAMAVLGHHKTVDGGLTRFERERSKPQSLEWAAGGVEEGERVARKIFADFGEDLPDIDWERCKRNARKPPSFAFHLHRYVERREGIRDTFALMKGLLMTADWGASSGELALQTTVRVGPEGVRKYLCDKGQREGWQFEGFRQFQMNCAQAVDHVIAVAPTGSGKTEAALLWGLNQVTHGETSKILYLLPTMVTANSLHARLEQFFGPQKHPVGLTHSLADLVRRIEEEQQESTGRENDRRAQLLFDRHFIQPVTVGTVDQLLTTLFHGGRWALKTFAALDAAIILDEIHSYDAYTTGLIFKAIKQLGSAGARFMVMTATMPASLVSALHEVLSHSGRVEIVRDQELLNAARSTYRTIDDDLTTHLDDIRAYIEAGKRVLVVVNTVARCQELAILLEDLIPICYHSKFILRDRKEKEQIILNEHPSLVIATQVVEVALDIDFDVLFTECAPPDAMAQRAGRINRKRIRKGEVVIFRPGAGSERIYFDDTRVEQGPEDSLLARSFQIFSRENGKQLTEQNLLDIIEKVYEGREPQCHPDFVQAQRLVEHDQGRFKGILDPISREDEWHSTRMQRYHQENVIPMIFMNEVLALEKPGDRRWFEVKMPFWYIKKNGTECDDLMFCEMEYDNHLGGRFSAEEGIKLF